MLNEEYWKRLRRIGDVVCQELSKDCCEKELTKIHRQILKLPKASLNNWRELPKEHGLYFAVNHSNEVLYIGKATGNGIRYRWSNHHRLDSFDTNKTKIHYLILDIEKETNNLLNAEQALIWAFKPVLNRVSNSFASSYAEVFYPCDSSLLDLSTVQKYLFY